MKRSLFLILWLMLPLSYGETLLIGTTAQNPPFSSMADKNDHFFGFDIDIMGEICQRLKLQCRFTPLNFDDLFTATKTGKIDLAIAAIVITTDRQQEFIFSLPYLESSGQFMALQQSTMTTADDLKNKRIGVRLGTPFKGLAQSVYNDQVNIVTYSRTAGLLDGLDNGKVDALLMDARAVRYWVTNNNTLYKVIGTPMSIGKGYGIMANPGQEKLIKQINQTLLKIQEDGTYLKIFSRYFDS